MTADERFERIERNLADITDKLRDTDEILRRRAIIAEQNEQRASQMMDTFHCMGRILQIHEQRIDSVEGRRPA